MTVGWQLAVSQRSRKLPTQSETRAIFKWVCGSSLCTLTADGVSPAEEERAGQEGLKGELQSDQSRRLGPGLPGGSRTTSPAHRHPGMDAPVTMSGHVRLQWGWEPWVS